MTARTDNHAPETDEQADSRPVELSVTYRQSDGQLRSAVIAVDLTNLWSIYDIPTGDAHARTGLVVEHLTGPGERLGAALAMLAEYVAGQLAFHNGERERHAPANPLPRTPQEVDLDAIHRDADRAQAATEAERERGSAPENAVWLARVMDLAAQQRHALEAETEPLAA
jgi:hypothetical protein